MSKALKLIISLFCVILGYAFLYVSWGGVYDFGVFINSILFSCSPLLIIVGFVYFIKVLAKRSVKDS